ncbi:Nucleotidyltransferase [Petrocella atlantisensis]|uniref:Nucleotidyltransferase n=1 Tax=Petrocella atlantisensis TaxID=2173034 RepID=A0A3P7PEP1_9FIRM|nr:sugar phosphate nucleotidyltransferase [Petrocella atlantisensis]VDN48543.1 Nucleotidyltransferase [Petrocella atlantisensis]
MDIKDYFVNEECTVIDAMEALDKVAKKVLFLCDGLKLIAAITDGDIRRWILRKGDLYAKIKEVANFNPKFLYEEKKEKAIEYMKKHSIEAIPICDHQMNILSVVRWNDDATELKKYLDVPVVVMAGGLGTRLYPYTKILPKPLIPIGEIPIAEHILNRFYMNGCHDFYLVINHKKNMIKAYFNEIIKKYDLTYIEEEEPLGTGGGLSLLKGKIESTFILSNCDIIILEDYSKIYKYHIKEKNKITMVCSLKKFKIPYGVVEIGENGMIESMKEKPELSFFTNTGMYIVDASIIEELDDHQFIGFPDIIQRYKELGEKIGVYPISENSWLDMGQLDEMEEMKRRLEFDV